MSADPPSQFRVLIGADGQSDRALDLSDRESNMPRLWRGFMAARILVAGVLLLMLLYMRVMGQEPQTLAFLICLMYLAVTVWARVLGSPSLPGARFDPQWLATIGVDVAVFAALLYLKVGTISYVPLFVLPVLFAAVLGPLLLALGTAATVTLVLLLDALQYSITQIPYSISSYVQAAVTSTGFFVLAYLMNQVASRLAAQERIARGSEMAARTQIKVNELIIQAFRDGVMVLDANGIVHAANPAAQDILKIRDRDTVEKPKPPFVLSARAAWQGLTEIAMESFQSRVPLQRDVVIDAGEGAQHLVHVNSNVSAVDGAPASGNLCVMFLQDLREMEARVRTEKLAAMGRMSAAVAHEIRNPLSAIAQANGLLAEDLRDDSHRALVNLVAQNVRRLNRVVEDVLEVARVPGRLESGAALLQAPEEIEAIVSDWNQQNHRAVEVAVNAHRTQTVFEFDREHLRRILVNLLDNALRHCTRARGSIQVDFAPCVGHASWQLRVWSDGSPIDEGVRRHLFEPFFSSQSRSSGLGLYISRELCLRHGAKITYERTSRHARELGGSLVQTGNEFCIEIRPISETSQTHVSEPLAGGPAGG